MNRQAETREGSQLDHRSRDQMIWIPGGHFMMGSDQNYPEEAPAHPVTVDGFWMDATCVTNRDFARFVKATGYVTLAERHANPQDYPEADPAALAPASAVFAKPPRGTPKTNAYHWWRYVPGADWRHPQGPESSIRGLMEHPVVHVAFEDAAAYAHWAGKDLPTEAEWEFAARGGLEGAEFVWGSELNPGGKHMANTWQGEFPWENLKSDGYEWTAPVASFSPNGYGLYDMAGNVWQWTSDWYQDHSQIKSPCCGARNPRGAERDASLTPGAPGANIPRKVVKGGSFLCAPNYCQRYRPAARLAQPIDTSTCHVGFRCISRQAPAAPNS